MKSSNSHLRKPEFKSKMNNKHNNKSKHDKKYIKKLDTKKFNAEVEIRRMNNEEC